MKIVKGSKNSLPCSLVTFVCVMFIAVCSSASMVNLDGSGGESEGNPIRVSLPVTVTWDTGSVTALQVYNNGQAQNVCGGPTCSSCVSIPVQNCQRYEIKAWCGISSCKSKWILVEPDLPAINADVCPSEYSELSPLTIASCFKVTWNSKKVSSVQVYDNGQLQTICDGTCSSCATVTLEKDKKYEVKIWYQDSPAPCSIWIKTTDCITAPTTTVTCPSTTATSSTTTSSSTTTTSTTTTLRSTTTTLPSTTTTLPSTTSSSTSTTSTSTSTTTTLAGTTSSLLSTTSTSTSSTSTSTSTTTTTLQPAGNTIVLAGYQAWHGLDSHKPHPLSPYRSDDPVVISRHIDEAKAQNINGFVVDWYGQPRTDVSNNEDRTFIDKATAELLTKAEEKGNFYVALMYDEGALNGIKESLANFTEEVTKDLQYAKEQGYFDSPAYFQHQGKPVVFIFPYENFDPKISWSDVKEALNIILLDKDPNPSDSDHDKNFDGFYPWVQATDNGWKADGSEWGEEYLKWFYSTMANVSPYSGKIKVGGVWPGFNDSIASWGSNRYMSRRCGQTWNDTWNLANANNPPIILIGTWNDFEEGSDIEFGTEFIGINPDPYPGIDSEDVCTNNKISVGFLDVSSSDFVSGSDFSVIDDSGNKVGGAVTYDDTAMTAVFTPTAILSYLTTYQVVITPKAKCPGGNSTPIDEKYEWSFVTIPASEINMDDPDLGKDVSSRIRALSPLKVRWNSGIEMKLQVYHDEKLIHESLYTPHAILNILETGKIYEIKTWIPNDSQPYSKWVEVVNCCKLKGDVDCNGHLDLKDAIIALNLLTVDVCGINSGADVNGDGNIGLAEAVYVLKELSK